MARAPSSAAAIRLLQSHSLTTLARHELERRILAGEIAPGDRLGEAELAGELSISRGPLREAFRALEQAGLVRTEKNRGVFVREVSPGEADQIYEVRAGLDHLIGRLAAERITPAQVAALRETLARMQDAARRKDVDDYHPLNVSFHAALAAAAGNPALEAVYGRLVNELHLYRRQSLARGPGSFPASEREHRQIVDAVAKRDAPLASRLLFEHALGGRARLRAALDDPPAPPATREIRIRKPTQPTKEKP